MFEKARGRQNYGYTFFENELTRHSLENAKRYDLILAGPAGAAIACSNAASPTAGC